MITTRIISLTAPAIAAVFVVSCSSSNKNVPPGLPQASTPGATNVVVPTAPPLQMKNGSSSFVARAVTAFGENTSPRFSFDGGKLLFLSRSRPTHKQAQVYELDLLRMAERRITFHDGDDFDPAWTATGRFVYASGTDELKEDTVALGRLRETYGKAGKAPKVDPARAREIYLQRLDGREIERLTSNDGYDGQPAPDPKNWRVVFVSERGTTRSIHVLDRNGTKRWSDGKTNEESPRFSRDGQWLAWVRKQNDGQSQIFVTEKLDARKARALTTPGYRDMSPAWSARGDWILFASNRGGRHSNLFAVDLKGTCMKELTRVEFDVQDPDWSPDTDRITFVAAPTGTPQIYVMDVKIDQLPCMEGGGAVPQPAAASSPTETP